MDAADGQPQAADNDIENTASPGSTPPPRAGQKRKRPDDDDAEAVRQENERLRQENNELRQQVHNLKNQLIAHLQQQLEQATAINIGNGTLL
jgi:predicted RNase H-like nuclease (RuvC/YqgF family)